MLNRSGSILAADFGNVHTRLVLFDTVDGSYRLVARAVENTTAGFPFYDVSIGLSRAATQLSQVTGRSLLDATRLLIVPESSAGGVDHFLATASTGRPLRTVLLGLVPEISIASAVRVTAGAYVEIAETISLDDTRSEEAIINAIIATQPDLILIAGGTEGGALEPVLALAQRVQLVLQLLERSRRPVVIYAGNSALVPNIRALLAGLAPLFIAPNVRPTLETEDLDGAQLQLGQAFDAFKENRGLGFDIVSETSDLGVLPTAQSYNLVVEYLGKAQAAPVLAVDIGSATGTLSAYLHGDVNTTIRTDFGLGHSAYNLLEHVGVEAIRRWLPFNASGEEITVYARNKNLRPGTIPQSIKDLYFEHAFLRAGLLALLRAARPTWYNTAEVDHTLPLPPFNPIIGAGAALTATGSPGFAALLLLDTLQPEGITRLQLDPYALIPALGALAYKLPEAMVQVIDNGGLEELGTSINLSGSIRVDRPALRVKITLENGQIVEQQVDGGHLWVYPLPVGQTAELDVRVLGRGTRIGGRGRIRTRVTGGTAGLIFDARGRPFALNPDVKTRAIQVPQWIAEATGLPAPAVDEQWLEPVKETATGSSESPAQPRRERRGWGRRNRQPTDEEAVDNRLKELTTPDDDEVSELDDLRNVLR